MDQLTSSSTVQAAMQLAAGGNYRAASALLNSIQEEDVSVEVCLLRAKMSIQQGNCTEAISQWQEVLNKEPGNQEAQAAIRKASQLKSRQGGVVFRRAKVFFVILLFSVVGLIGVFSFIVGRGSINASGLDSVAAKELMRIQSRQSKQISKVEGQLRSLTAKSSIAPDLKVVLPGIMQSVDGNSVVLTFEKGLFYSGTNRLVTGGVSFLSSLGGQLKAHAGKISITVTGHTDDIPMIQGSKYADNASLGLARAVVVVDQLRASSKLPSSVFVATSAGELMSPYPNDLQENRTRNRTVVLRIFDDI